MPVPVYGVEKSLRSFFAIPNQGQEIEIERKNNNQQTEMMTMQTRRTKKLNR